MSEAERQTQTHLRDLFQSRGISPRKILGQNFLIDLNLVEYIVAEARLTPDDVVLEIGAGTGSMTAMLAAEAGDVISVEIDPVMHKLAGEAVAMYDNVTLLNCDALKNKNTFAPAVISAIEEKLAERPGRTLKLVANLPYVIATPVVSNLVKTELPWSAMIVTIQWELGQRMRARAGSAHYGALSVWLQSQARVKTLKRLPPTVFWPRPKVTSAIVRLLPEPRLKKRILDRDFFHDFVRRLFHHRRKLLRSVLVGMYRKQLSKADIDAILAPFRFGETARAEELDVKTLVALSAAFRAAMDVPERIGVEPS